MAQAMLYGNGGGSGGMQVATGTFTSDYDMLYVSGLKFKPMGFMMSHEELGHSDGDPRYVNTVWSFKQGESYPHYRCVYAPTSSGTTSRTRYYQDSDGGTIDWGNNYIELYMDDSDYEYIEGIWHYVIWGE